MAVVQAAGEAGRRAVLAELRARLAPSGESAASPQQGWSFGYVALDEALPARAAEHGRLHEIVFAHSGDQAAATGFAAALALRLAGADTVFWCQRTEDRREAGRLYGPGIAALGGDATRFIHVCVRRDVDVLWAMEEAIASGAVPVVVGEAARIDLTASRRLALAAEKSDVTALFLRPSAGSLSNAAWTRFLVAPAPSAPNPFDARAPGCPRFFLTLQRARTGIGAAGTLSRPCLVEWNHETHCFAMAAPLADRTPPVAQPAYPAGRLELVRQRRSA